MKKILGLTLILGYSLPLLSQISNQNMSGGVVFDGEPTLAMDPGNPQRLVTAWLGFQTFGQAIQIKTRASTDGGTTWSPVQAIPHFASGNTSADPTLAFDGQGNVYLALIDYNKAAGTGGIWVLKSTDGGLSWPTSFQAFDAGESSEMPIDRPWLVCDRSGGTTDGYLYISTMSANWDPLPNYGFFKRSTDGGATWSPLTQVDSTGWLIGNAIQKPAPVCESAADGSFYLAYPSYVLSQSFVPRMLLARSANGGQGFSRSVIYGSATPANDSLLKSGTHLAADPAHPGYLALSSLDAPNGDADLFVLHSTDYGATWSAPSRVNDDTPGNGVTQDMAWLTFSPSGKLVVSWRDRRNGGGVGYRQSTDIRFSVSTDLGATWGTNFLLSSQTVPYDSVLDGSGNDFMGLTATDDSLFAVWGDVRTGKLNVFFAKSSLAGGPVAISSLGTEEWPQQKVYPIGGGRFRVEFPPALEPWKVWEWVDVSGKVLVKQELTPGALQWEQDMAGIPTGIYYSRLQSEKAVSVVGFRVD